MGHADVQRAAGRPSATRSGARRHDHQPRRAALRHVRLTKAIVGRRPGRLHRRDDPGLPRRLQLHARRRADDERHPQPDDGPGGVAGGPIPTGSVCTLTRDAHTQPGDFADRQLRVGRLAVSPTAVTIANSTTATATITNTFTRGSAPWSSPRRCGRRLPRRDQPQLHRGVQLRHRVPGQRAPSPTAPARRSAALPAGCVRGPGGPARARAAVAGVHLGHADVVARAAAAVVAGNGSTTVTVSNPTPPVFGRVSVTKAVAGATKASSAARLPDRRHVRTTVRPSRSTSRPAPRRPRPTSRSVRRAPIAEDPPARRPGRRFVRLGSGTGAPGRDRHVVG